ncbi:MAG: hypothetical protein Q8L02_06600 [Candidatus Nitrotoga sp.]|nr:hypothetical protein [Candidatus Nitrotoga sp.]
MYIVSFNKFCNASTVVQQVQFLTDSGVKPEAKLAREVFLLPTESHGATICRISTLDELSYSLAPTYNNGANAGIGLYRNSRNKISNTNL